MDSALPMVGFLLTITSVVMAFVVVDGIWLR